MTQRRAWRIKSEHETLSLVSIKTCRVSCQDLDGVEHSVEVEAESLYEAVARGLKAFHTNSWVGEIGEGLTTVTIEVRERVPEKVDVRHQVRMLEFKKWLERRGTTPAQITARQRVREILGTPAEPSDRQSRRRWQEERNR